MMKEINYPIVAIIIIGASLLIIWLIRRNQIDEKKFEKDTINSEIQPGKEKDDQQGGL